MYENNTLYVSDLDGTLLNDSSILSPVTERTLNELIADGALFTIATARTPATAVDLMRNVNTNIPFIVMAGCALWDNGRRDYISARTICPNHMARILGIFERRGSHPFVYHRRGNKIVVEHASEMTDAELDFIRPRILSPYKCLETVEGSELNIDTSDVMLIFGMGNFDHLRAIADDIDRERIPCSYNCYHDIFDKGLGFIDIYMEGTTKALAIEQVKAATGAERVVVFGDNLNDIPMMRAADWSVAVENAYSEVKLAASEVIGLNTDDAVVKWIKEDRFRLKSPQIHSSKIQSPSKL